MKPNGTDPSAPTALQPSTVLRACSVRMPSTVLRIIRNTSFMRRKRKPRSVSPVHPLDVNIAVSDNEIRPLAGYDAAAPVLSAKITSDDAKALWGTAAESEPLRDAAEQSTRTGYLSPTRRATPAFFGLSCTSGVGSLPRPGTDHCAPIVGSERLDMCTLWRVVSFNMHILVR